MMLVLVECDRCAARRWHVRVWPTRREKVAWRDWPARAGVTIRAHRWMLVLGLLGRRQYVDTRILLSGNRLSDADAVKLRDELARQIRQGRH